MPRSRKQQMDASIPADPQPHPLGGTVDEPEETSDAILAPVYETATGHHLAFLDRIIKKFHKPMAEEGVKITMQFWRDAEGNDSVKVRGLPVFGKIITFSADKRAAGAPDARIIIDGHKWDNADVSEQEAALDSILEQKEICTKEDTGQVSRDKAGRPRLKRRKPDMVLEGYKRVAEEHGSAAQETKAYAVIQPTFAQMDLFEAVTKMQAVG